MPKRAQFTQPGLNSWVLKSILLRVWSIAFAFIVTLHVEPATNPALTFVLGAQVANSFPMVNASNVTLLVSLVKPRLRPIVFLVTTNTY